jgi:hypothetical protein
MEIDGICCGHLEYFAVIWYILWTFGNVVVIWYITTTRFGIGKIWQPWSAYVINACNPTMIRFS